jgi:release factor glutamine methyltransferase
MSTATPAPTRLEIITVLRKAGCVFAEDEADLLIGAALAPDELIEKVERRVAGEPLEYVLGWAQFCGMRIEVDSGVFVPRRRTEFLVAEAVALAPAPPVVVDVCCGSGAVGVAVAEALQHDVELHAVDIDAAAVRCASRNLARVGGLAYEGDLFEPLPSSLGGRVDLVVCNAPYVPTDAIAMMPPEARLYEPRVALDGGADGVATQRRVAAETPRWLAPGGHLLIETSEAQIAKTVGAFTESGFTHRVAHSVELSATVVIGSRP